MKTSTIALLLMFASAVAAFAAKLVFFKEGIGACAVIVGLSLGIYLQSRSDGD